MRVHRAKLEACEMFEKHPCAVSFFQGNFALPRPALHCSNTGVQAALVPPLQASLPHAAPRPPCLFPRTSCPQDSSLPPSVPLAAPTTARPDAAMVCQCVCVVM